MENEKAKIFVFRRVPIELSSLGISDNFHLGLPVYTKNCRFTLSIICRACFWQYNIDECRSKKTRKAWFTDIESFQSSTKPNSNTVQFQQTKYFAAYDKMRQKKFNSFIMKPKRLHSSLARFFIYFRFKVKPSDSSNLFHAQIAEGKNIIRISFSAPTIFIKRAFKFTFFAITQETFN